jgi:hypothetical protein
MVEKHPPGCRCPICVSLELWPDDEEVTPQPKSKGKAAQPQPAGPANGKLPAPWLDAIAFAVGLGMKQPAAERKATILAIAHPRASQPEAIRLLMGGE